MSRGTPLVITDPRAGDLLAYDGARYFRNYSQESIGVPSSLVLPNAYNSDHTLELADSRGVTINSASSNQLTVPPNSSVPFAVGTIVVVEQYGAGQTTLTAGSGVTIRSRGGLLALAGQYAVAVLRKVSANEWLASGDLA